MPLSSSSQEQTKKNVASAVLTALRHLAGGGVNVIAATELRGCDDDVFEGGVTAASSAANSSISASINENDHTGCDIKVKEKHIFDWRSCQTGSDIVKPTTNSNHPRKSSWLQELETLAFSSVSFPNGSAESRGKSKKKNKANIYCNKCDDATDGKPHDVEVRAALSLFHRVRSRGMLRHGHDCGSGHWEQQGQSQQPNQSSMRKRFTENRDDGNSCPNNSRLGKRRKERHRQSRHLQHNAETDQSSGKNRSYCEGIQTNSNACFELISDLGTRREIDSVTTLANLLSVELEHALKGLNSAPYRKEPISKNINPEELPSKIVEGDPTTNDIPASSSHSKSVQKSLEFFDVRPDSSGVICLTSQVRSTMLRQAGKLPCPHCIKWFKGTKGLWWHQLSVHGMEYSVAAGSAAWEVNPLAIVPFGEGNRGLVDAMRMKDHRVDVFGESKRDDRGNNDKDVDVFEFVKCGMLQEVVKRVEGGFQPNNILDRNGASTLHWAAGCGHLEIASYLVTKCHCDPNQGQRGKRSFMGRTPLHWAARNGHLNVVKFLVDECGANIDAVTSDGTTAFCWAAWQGHLAVMQYLHKRGCDIHTLNSFGCNAVLWSAQGAGTIESLSWLLHSGSDFSLVNSNGHSALHKAAQRGSRTICKFLVDNFLIINEIPSFGFSFIGPDTEGSCPSDLCRMEGHDSLAQWISKQECGFIVRFSKEEFYDVLDNERIPTWLREELNRLQCHEAKFEVLSQTSTKENSGLVQMALKLLENIKCVENDDDSFRNGTNNDMHCID